MMTWGCSRESSSLNTKTENNSAIRNDLFSMAEKRSGAYQIVTKTSNNALCESIFLESSSPETQ